MPTFSRRISLFSRLIPFNYSKGGKIEDDWEYIEVHQEFACEENDTAFIEDTETVDHGESNFFTFPSLQHSVKIKYTILSKDEVLQRLEDKVTKVSNVLLLPKNEAALLLQHFKWDDVRTFDEWLGREEKVRKKVGLLVKPVVETPTDAAEIACRICHTNIPRDALLSVSCGHLICDSCWEGYIREAINDEQCLTLRCPEPSCNAAVGLYLIKLFLFKDDEKKKFENHLLRSYLACSNEGKLCPASDCNYAVLSSHEGEGNVTCRCLYSFCWSCSREAHAPVDCFTLTRWMSERISKSEDWLLANTSSCPNCRAAYEERPYVYYEKCISCGHEYFSVSVCGDDWNENGTEGYETDSCNADSGRRGFFKKSLQRYNHYYTKWATCESSRANALTDLKLLLEFQRELLCGIFGISATELNFLDEALLQVAECWQFLKWTHVYGYYLPANEDAKKHLFEFMQEKATDLVGQLEKHIEELFQDSLEKEIPFAHFLEFRSKITKLTRVLKDYFDHLMDGLKSGLSEVACTPKPHPSHRLARDREETSCSLESTLERMDICPITKVTKGVDDMDISEPVSRSLSADMLVQFSGPELQTEPKVENY